MEKDVRAAVLGFDEPKPFCSLNILIVAGRKSEGIGYARKGRCNAADERQIAPEDLRRSHHGRRDTLLAPEVAKKAFREADRAEVEAWSIRMEGYGAAQPSPTTATNESLRLRLVDRQECTFTADYQLSKQTSP